MQKLNLNGAITYIRHFVQLPAHVYRFIIIILYKKTFLAPDYFLLSALISLLWCVHKWKLKVYFREV